MNAMRVIDLPARLLMSLLFLLSGFSKLAQNTAIQGYMQAYGVPGGLSWPAAAWELSAGLLLL
ncbi:MAG: DoxX family membrane protein, partial [Janthinobacterium lividum]